LSVLDGVPIAVKEEMDAIGMPTRLGTAFIDYLPAEKDAAEVFGHFGHRPMPHSVVVDG
jgi:Asp-tRNA(Asn)/Glu-tRNA(Gln) amidotransferase A subunit family amidase